jgi:hypothetical protein
VANLTINVFGSCLFMTPQPPSLMLQQVAGVLTIVTQLLLNLYQV